jgi:hypothetical protein
MENMPRDKVSISVILRLVAVFVIFVALTWRLLPDAPAPIKEQPKVQSAYAKLGLLSPEVKRKLHKG